LFTVGSLLGIDVPQEVLAQWTGWFAPDPRPFVVDGSDDLGGSGDVARAPEVRGT
jgi:hypothetical protein